MKSFVLRDKGRNLTGPWIFAFALAFLATLVASSYVLSMLLRGWFVLASNERSVSSILFVPWSVWVPVTAIVAYAALGDRKWALLVGKPPENLYELLVALDASPVDEDSRDPLVRRLANVNQEIAIAAGCVPAALYVLQNDYSVNALTIGSPRMAVICVTRWALRNLKRAEIQAVVAHEYGHVVNDDVTGNTRLLYWLGALLPQRSRNEPSRFWWVFVGVALTGAISSGMAVTLAGAGDALKIMGPGFGAVAWLCGIVIVGMTIKAIVTPIWRQGANAAHAALAGSTREREFEADGISAQLTREPQALASVLRKIAGLRTETSLSPRHAAMVAHMCIASGLFGTEDHRFATHPTLEERLEALGHPLTPEERVQLAQAPREAAERYAAEVNAELGILYAAEPQEHT